jgi:hypothetical protein
LALRALRAFCGSVRELNNALLWVTREGAPEKSNCKFDCRRLVFRRIGSKKFARDWLAQLQKMFS